MKCLQVRNYEIVRRADSLMLRVTSKCYSLRLFSSVGLGREDSQTCYEIEISGVFLVFSDFSSIGTLKSVIRDHNPISLHSDTTTHTFSGKFISPGCKLWKSKDGVVYENVMFRMNDITLCETTLSEVATQIWRSGCGNVEDVEGKWRTEIQCRRLLLS